MNLPDKKQLDKLYKEILREDGAAKREEGAPILSFRFQSPEAEHEFFEMLRRGDAKERARTALRNE